MKMEMWIVLPGEKSFKIWMKNPDREWTKTEFDIEVENYCKVCSISDRFTIAIINALGEKETLILWGNVLKNTYIVAKLV